jgi:uncharacterized protein (TIGR02453 family)
VAFTGIPEAALDFYDDLETDNTRSFWTAHADVYAACVKEPMIALCEELSEEFGEAKMFRPNRDVRFSKDKSPYKTAQGAYVPAGPALGWYVQLSAAGLMTGAGFYQSTAEQLRTVREVIAGPRGSELEKLLKTLRAAGWEVGGDTLATAPRGYEKDHPRIALLRHKTLTVRHAYGFEPVIHTHEFADAVRADWRACRPLVEWFAEIL